MELSFKGKTVVVTGGTSGIGFAIAQSFLHAGADVVICGTNPEKLEKAINSLRLLKKDRIEGWQCDVSDAGQMEQFVQKIEAEFGGCDVWINNAGISPRSSIAKTTPEMVDKIFATNLKSIVLSAHYIPRLMPNGGVVLNTGSIAGIMPTTTSGVYGASKAAVATLTRSLAGEFAPLGIRVVCFAPGMIDTDGRVARMSEEEQRTRNAQIALHRAGQPQEVADTVLFLASDYASYITGVCVEVTGGKFCVQNPGLAW